MMAAGGPWAGMIWCLGGCLPDWSLGLMDDTDTATVYSINVPQGLHFNINITLIMQNKWGDEYSYVTYFTSKQHNNLVIGLFLSSAFPRKKRFNALLIHIVFSLIRLSLSTRNYFWLLILIAAERSWDASVTSDKASLITKQSDFLWASEFNSDLRKITFPPVLIFTLDSERISSELGLQLLIVQQEVWSRKKSAA